MCSQGACDACAPGYLGDGGSCQDVAGVLAGLRWELPCGTHFATGGCYASDATPTASTLSGSSGVLYDVTLRFRGVIELESYTPAAADGGYWVQDATPANDGNNIYALQVSQPAATYYLNSGTHLPYCLGIDYTQTITVQAGATVTLTARAVDGAEVTNIDSSGNPIVIDGIPPAPDAYDGQFVQMDVLSVAPH